MFLGSPSIITPDLLLRMTIIHFHFHFQLLHPFLLSARPLQFILLLAALFNFCACNQPQPNCLNSTCGNFKISYPFGRAKSGCGHPEFQIDCESSTPYLTINKISYKVLGYNQDSMKIASGTVFTDCGLPEAPVNLTASLFNLADSSDQSITLGIGCPAIKNLPVFYVPCGNDNDTWVLPSDPEVIKWIPCSSTVQFPVLQQLLSSLTSQNFWNVLRGGFEVEWNKNDEAFKMCRNCTSSGGICGYNVSDSSKPFLCYLPQSPGSPQNARQPQSPDLVKNASQPQGPDSAQNTREPGDSHSQTGTTSPNNGLSHQKPRGKSYSGILTGVCVGFALLMGSVAVLVARMRKRDRRTKQRLESADYRKDKELGALCMTESSLPFFCYEELEEATGFFDEKKELGDGAFGSVYLGNLWDGSLVAVKRLYHDNSRRLEQFGNEVRILSSLKHPNLVLLIGYCQDRRELLLVYEYVPNGTLADHLHGENRGKGLSWETRLNIAVETAQALAYLHFCVNPPIFHRDVKSNNILLDENFRAKVADFGLSRLVPAEASHVSTAPQGTPGYLDPDYQQCYRLSDKSDVYSFGVVLVELISAKKAVDITREKRDIGLANLAVSKIQCGALHELVDPNLEIDSNPHVKAMVTGVAELAFRCLAYEKDDRPNMMEVAAQLQQLKQVEHGGCPGNQRSSTDFVH